MEPEPRQARFLRQRPPGRPPAFQVPRRVKASELVIDYPLAAERELRNKGSKDEVRRFHGAKALRPLAKTRKSRNSYPCERDDPFARSRHGLANCQSAGKQVHVTPLQPFQLAASCSRIQTEDRSKVGRFPFRPHYSRFEKPQLFFLTDRSSDGARLSEGLYIVSNTCPELRSLQNAPQNAQLGVECGGADSLFRSPGPVISDPLHGDGLERLLFEVGPQLHQELLFLCLAGVRQLQLPGAHVFVRCL